MSAPLTRPLSDTLFIAEFAAFCRTKGDGRYEFWNFGRGDCGCAITQFTFSRGEKFAGCEWIRAHMLTEAAADAKPETFSALADRLEALIADEPTVRAS